jgi:hypothetical protein
MKRPVSNLPIFISHSSRDADAAARLKGRLETLGFIGAFLDFDPADGIPAGRDWEQELYAQLRRAAATIVVWSRAASESKWVFAEITQAHMAGKPVFAWCLDETALPPSLSRLQKIAKTGDDAEASARLLDGLNQAGLDPADAWLYDRDRAPYPGLAPFEESDVSVFCGREREIQECLDLITRERHLGAATCLSIIGPSGSGKSSLLRAGIVPRLRKDASHWKVVGPLVADSGFVVRLGGHLADVMDPPGDADSIVNLLTQAGDPDATVSTGAIETLSLRLLRGRSEARVLIAVDQFEGLLTGGPSTDGIVRLLAQWMGAPRLPAMVVLTMRADFVDAFAKHPLLAQVPKLDVMVGPLSRTRFGEAIEQPARLAEVTFDAGLVQRLIMDAESDDAMPLLAHTLRVLWDKGAGDRRLSLDDYEKSVGGLSASINTTAEAALGRDLSNHQLKDVRAALLEMARIGEGGRVVRAVAPLSAMPTGAKPVLDRLVEARLLVTRVDSDPEGASRVGITVTHEAIFRTWKRLTQWIEEERPWLEWRKRLHAMAVDWTPDEGKAGPLLHGSQLAEARRWETSYDKLAAVEQAFLAASFAAERRARNSRRVFFGIGGLLTAILLVLGILWGQSRRAEQRQRDATFANQLMLDALALIDRYHDRGLLLAAEANRAADSFTTRRGLLDALRRTERIDLVLHNEAVHPGVPLRVADDRTLFSVTVARVQDEAPIGLIGWDLKTRRRYLVAEFRDHGEASFDEAAQTFVAANGAELNTGQLAVLNERHLPGVSEQNAAARSAPICPRTDGDQYAIVSANQGRAAYSTKKGEVGLCDLTTGQRRAAPALGSTTAVALAPDGNHIAVAANDGTITIVDARNTMMVESRFHSGVHGVTSLSWKDDGTYLAAVGDRVARVELGTRAVVSWPLPARAGFVQVAFVRRQTVPRLLALWRNEHSAKPYVAFAVDDAGWAVAPTVSGGSSLLGSDAGGPPESCTYANPDGIATLVTYQSRSVLELRDKGGLENAIPGISVMSCLDSGGLIAGGMFGRLWRLDSRGDLDQDLSPGWSSATTQAFAIRDLNGFVLYLGTSRDDRLIVSGTLGGTTVAWRDRAETFGWRQGHAELGIPGPYVRTYDSIGFTKSAVVVRGQAGSPNPVPFQVALDLATGTILGADAAEGATETTPSWTAEVDSKKGEWIVRRNGQERFRSAWPTGVDRVGAIAIHPEGTVLAIGNADASTDDSVRLIDPTTGRLLATLVGHTHDLEALAFSRDGAMLASADHEENVILWDVGGRSRIGLLPRLGGRVDTLRFSDTGEWLVAAGSGVTVWSLRAEDWRQVACRRAHRALNLSEWSSYLKDRPYRPYCAPRDADEDTVPASLVEALAGVAGHSGPTVGP